MVGKSAQINHGSVGRGRTKTELCCQHMCAGALRTDILACRTCRQPAAPCGSVCGVCVVANCAVIAEDLL